jgi:flagellar hook-associated protein 1 FlgK
MVERLSELVNITVGRSDRDEVMVYISGENLVQGQIVHPLQATADPNNHGFYRIQWETTGTEVTLTGGVLTGLLHVRDQILRENINDVNSFAINMADLTNEVHRDGSGEGARPTTTSSGTSRSTTG